MSSLAKVSTEEFSIGFKRQQVWGIPHAAWFFAMGVGGGLYLLRLLLDVGMGRILGVNTADAASIILIAIGGAILIVDLGQPQKVFRALINARSSWIARGAIADVIFLGAGISAILPEVEHLGSRPFAGLPWSMHSGVGITLQLIAGAAAIVVIIYAGLVLAAWPAIPFWNTPLVPLQFLLYGLSGALAMVFVTLPVVGPMAGKAGPIKSLEIMQLLLLLLLAGLTAAHMGKAKSAHPAAKESARLLTRGALASTFMAGVVGTGQLLPLILTAAAYLATGPTELWLLAVSGSLALVGNFLSRLCTLRAGIYGPYLTLPSQGDALAGDPLHGSGPPPWFHPTPCQ